MKSADTLGWNRKHTIKALNGKVTMGPKAKKRGSKPSYGEEEAKIIINEFWRNDHYPSVSFFIGAIRPHYAMRKLIVLLNRLVASPDFVLHERHCC